MAIEDTAIRAPTSAGSELNKHKSPTDDVVHLRSSYQHSHVIPVLITAQSYFG